MLNSGFGLRLKEGGEGRTDNKKEKRRKGEEEKRKGEKPRRKT